MKTPEKALAVGVAVLYAAFIAVDIVEADRWELLSSSLKYAGMWCCFAYVLLSRKRALSPYDWKWVAIAFAFAVAADALMLFKGNPLVGLAIFCGAHLAHQHRYRFKAFRPLFIATVAFWVCILALRLAGVDGFLKDLGALWYGLLLIADVVGAFRADMPRVNARLAKVGIVLFFLCDVNVALHNGLAGGTLVYYTATTFMWVFYMPAQLCLALSVIRYGGEDNERARM